MPTLVSDTCQTLHAYVRHTCLSVSDTCQTPPAPYPAPMPPQTTLSTLLQRLTRPSAGDPTHSRRRSTTRPHKLTTRRPDQQQHPTGTPTGFHTPSYPDAHT